MPPSRRAGPWATSPQPFDLVAVAFSKGLGAPGGSLLAGSRELLGRAARYRRMFGGAMRQIGIFGAAGLYALDHNDERLAEDHANARRLAERLAASPRIVLDLASVQTNIIVFRLTDDAPDAPTVVARARDRGVLLFNIGPRTLRAVTHLDVSRKQCEEAAEILVGIAEGQKAVGRAAAPALSARGTAGGCARRSGSPRRTPRTG